MMINKKIILGILKKAGKSQPWSSGVMEYWSVDKNDINPLTITPVLQYSNAPIFYPIDPK